MHAVTTSDLHSTAAGGSDERAEKTRLLFWLFVLAHVGLWTLLPILTQPNLPLDTIEMRYFGHEWQLGYYKHPPLPSWIAEGVARMTGGLLWVNYLVAQVCVATCFWAAWRLGREILSPHLAVLAACLLECSWYYNISSTEFNNNVGMYPFWALAILFLYWALRRGSNAYWLATGVALGLAVLAKYSAAVLAMTMLVFMFVHPQVRGRWRCRGPYLTILAAAIVVGPHAYWALASGLPAVDFAMERTRTAGPVWGHLWYPLSFAGSQLLSLVPMVLVAALALGGRARWRGIPAAERFHRDFLLAMVVGPLVAHMLISGLLLLRLRSMYGSQLWTFAGVLLVFYWDIGREWLSWRRAAAALSAVAALYAGTFVVHDVAGPYLRGKPSRIHFPGRELAAEVHQLWSRRHAEPLAWVTGEWWMAGNVAVYGPSRPSVYGGNDPDLLTASPRYSSWASDELVARQGGVILWDARRHGRKIPSELNRWARIAEFPPPITLAWQTGAAVPPLEIGMAIIAPGSVPPGVPEMPVDVRHLSANTPWRPGSR